MQLDQTRQVEWPPAVVRVLGSFSLDGGQKCLADSAAVRIVQLLAFAAPQVVASDEIADAVWRDDRPSTWKSALRTHLAAARSLLADAPVDLTISRLPTGFVLAGDIQRVDSVMLRSLASSRTEDLRCRVQELTTAKTLWRGDLFPTLMSRRAVAEHESLVALRDQLVLQWARVTLQLGQQQTVIEELSPMFTDVPSDAPLAEALVAALVGDGQSELARQVLSTHQSAIRECGLQVSSGMKALARQLVAHESDPQTDLPSFLVSDRRLVERSLQLDQAFAHLTQDAPNAVVVVHGEPGVGKSLLLGELAARLMKVGVQILAAHATEHSAPFAVLESLLSPWKKTLKSGAHTPADLLAHVVHDTVGRTMVLLIDDFQWVDLASCKALRTILESPRPSNVAVIVATRTDEGPPFVSRLVDDLIHRPTTQVVSVRKFDVPGVASLVNSRRPHLSASEVWSLANSLHHSTSGLPMLCDMLLDRDLDLDAMRADILCTVENELETLDDQARNVAEVAALVGVEFRLADIAETMGLSIARVIDAVDICTRRGLMGRRVGMTGRFRHALLRESVVAATKAQDRAGYHRRIAAVFEQRHGLAWALVHRAEALIDSDSSDDVRAVLDGIVTLQRSLQWEQSVWVLEIVRRVTSSQPWLLDARTRLQFEVSCASGFQAVEHWEHGRAAFRIAFNLAVQLGDVDAIVQVARESAGSNQPIDQDSERLAWLETAVQVSPSGSEGRLRCLAELVYLRSVIGSDQTGSSSIAQLRKLEMTTTDPVLAGIVQHGLLTVHLGYPPSKFRMRLTKAIALAGYTEPEAAATSMLIGVSGALADGDIQRAKELMQSLRLLTKTRGRIGDLWIEQCCDAVFAAWHGDFESGQQLADAALHRAERHALPEGFAAWASYNVADALRTQDWSSLLPFLSSLDLAAGTIPDRAAAVRLLIEAEDTVQADVVFWDVLAMLKQPARGVVWQFGAALLADAAPRLGQNHCLEMHRLLLPFSGSILVAPFIPVAIFGPADAYLSRLAREMGDLGQAAAFCMSATSLLSTSGLCGWDAFVTRIT
jgi:DNA-binding SARP family transcriptional activator